MDTKIGFWEYHPATSNYHDFFECSECGMNEWTTECNDLFEDCELYIPRYCPDCGTKMNIDFFRMKKEEN